MPTVAKIYLIPEISLQFLLERYPSYQMAIIITLQIGVALK